MALSDELYEEIRERLKFDLDFTSWMRSRAEIDPPQITKDNIVGFPSLRFGVATVTWPGGQVFSSVTQITHGFPTQATIKFATFDALGLPGLTAVPVVGLYAGLTPQQMAAQAFTVDGQLPAAGSSGQFYWLAGLNN